MNCIKCGREQKRSKDDWCCLCRQRRITKENYQKNKNNPDFIIKRRENMRKWISNNQNKWRTLSNKNTQNWWKRKRDEWRAKGLCIRCGAKREDLNFIQCVKCREIGRKSNQKFKNGI